MDALPFPRTKLAALVAATLLSTAPKRAASREGLRALTSGPLASVAAGPGRLFALSGSEVLTFDDDGQLLGRCAGFTPPPPHERRAALVAPDADEVLRAEGLDDDDDGSPAAEDALENEGLGPKRRPGRSQTERGILPHALATEATSAGGAWIATSSGVFRGDEHGCRRAGLDGRDLLVVATGGGTVVAATEDLLFRRADRSDQDAASDDATFAVAAGLTERPRALAVGADGAAIVADDDGVLVVGSDGAATRILDRPVDALAVCGGEALAVADDGIYRWTPGTLPARTSDRPPVRGIACGPTRQARFVATGLGVWTSPDAATWTERAETLGRRIAGAATVGDRTWLAIDNGLVALDLTAPERAPSSVSRSVAALDAAGLAPLPTRRLVASPFPWPEVTALLGAERRTPDRRGWEVMLLLTFPFDRIAHRRVDPVLVAAESARRDAALAREQIDLATRDDGDADQPDADERDARLHTVLQEREALR